MDKRQRKRLTCQTPTDILSRWRSLSFQPKILMFTNVYKGPRAIFAQGQTENFASPRIVSCACTFVREWPPLIALAASTAPQLYIAW